MQTAAIPPQTQNRSAAIDAAKRRRTALLVVALTAAVMFLSVCAMTMPYWHILGDKLAVDRAPSVSTGLPTSKVQLRDWQTRLKGKLAGALKIDLHRPSAEHFRVVDDKIVRTLMFDGNMFSCRRQTIQFDSQSGTPGFAYLLLPEMLAADAKLPCVICLPGHGAGVDHTVGIDPDGSLMAMWDKTPRDFALFFACRGYAVLAIEQAGIGKRAQAPLNLPGLEKAECLFSDAKLRYAGKTSLGERVADVMAAVDMLQRRKEIDTTRLAVMGLSAGGTTALYSAALDERLKCAIVVSAFSTYADSTFRQLQCMCNYVPGLPSLCDSADVAALIAPRSLFIESGLSDDRFPARSAKSAYEKARAAFVLSGTPANIAIDFCNHGHRCFFGKEAVKFLAKQL